MQFDIGQEWGSGRGKKKAAQKGTALSDADDEGDLDGDDFERELDDEDDNARLGKRTAS